MPVSPTVTTAVILAAGTGSRLQPYTHNLPKCLVEVLGKPILGHMLDTLEAVGFREVVIVTGFKAERVETYLKGRTSGMRITTVHNARYATTNNIYSLWLAEPHLTDGFALIESDIVLDGSVMQQFLVENRIALERFDPSRHNGTTAEVCCDGYLCDLHIKKEPPSHKKLYKTVNIYSFCAQSKTNLLQRIHRRIEQQDTAVFYELAIKDLLDEQQIRLKMVDFSDHWWDEIDTPADLLRAEENGRPYLALSSTLLCG